MVVVGSAEFILSADNAALLKGLVEAERATAASARKQADAIAKASGASVAEVKRAAQQMAAEHKRAGDAAVREAERSAKAQQQSSAQFIGGAKAAGALALAIVGVTASATALNSALSKVAESTQKQAQAQFSINALYGSAAPLITAQAEALAKSAGRSKTEALDAASAVANLGRQYAFTLKQQEQVLQISAELAAVKGITLEAATARVSDALRGEAEAAEYLGQVLGNDAVKAFAAMTDEQRKNFETLSPITKAQLTLGKLVGDNADLMGIAAQRANSQVGAFDKLAAATDNLAATVGGKLAPAFAAVLSPLTAVIEAGDRFARSPFAGQIELVARLSATMAANILSARSAYEALLAVQRASAGVGAEGRIQVGPDPGMPGSGPGPTPGQIQASRDAEADREKAEAAAKDALRAEVERHKKAAEEIERIEEKAARDAEERRQESIEQTKIALEVEQAARLKALEEQERNAIRAIEVERQAAKDASEEQIKQAERRKDAEISAADAAADAATSAINAREDALERERELEDRDLEDGFRRFDEALEATRDAEDRRVEARADALDRMRDLEDQAQEDRQRAEDQARTQRRQSEDRELAASRQAQDRAHEERQTRLDAEREAENQAREDRRRDEDASLAAAQAGVTAAITQGHAQRMAAIEAEISAIEQRTETELAGLEQEADALRDAAEHARKIREREHRAALDGLDAEEDAGRAKRDDLIRGLEVEADTRRRVADEALRQVDHQRDAEDDRHRQALANLEAEERKRLGVVDAELARLDAADRAARDAERDQSLRNAVSTAERGVQKAQSTGNLSEIEKAERELADARQAILDEQTRRTRDAARDQLEARKQAIREEIAARKDAEDEANRLRGEQLTAEQQAIKDSLASELDAIKVRRDAIDAALELDLAAIARRRDELVAAYDAEREAAQEGLEARLDEIAQRRKALEEETTAQIVELQKRRDAEQAEHAKNLERVRLEFDAQKKALDDKRREEDRERSDRRGKEDDRLAADLRRIRDLRSAEDLALTDRRKKEDDALAARRLSDDRALKDSRDAQDAAAREDATRLTLARQNEDRILNERRTAEARERKDRRDAEDLALRLQLAAVQANLEVERRAIDAHYNGHPNGIIPQISAAMEKADAAYAERLRLARIHFDAERDAIRNVYRNEKKEGLLDLQDEAARNSRDKLTDQIADINAWKRTYLEAISAVSGGISSIPNLPSPGGSNPGGGSPGAPPVPGGIGPPAPPGYGGTPGVPGGSIPPGDVGAWLQAAAQRTGAGPDWIGGLTKLVGLESSGNPRAVNPGPPDENGEVAMGLLQMKPSTFRSYRDPQLPNDIFDPIANATGSIRYIKDQYQHVNNIPGLYGGTFKGYATGGWIDRPSLIVDEMSMRPYARAGEGGRAEWVGPVMNPGQSGGGRHDQIDLTFKVDDNTIERWIFRGIGLSARRGDIQDIRRAG